jgi:Flp pilus assembly protein CpaB
MRAMTSMRTKFAILAVAVLVAVIQLQVVDALARHRTAAPELPVVQFKRVIVTAQRTAQESGDMTTPVLRRA